MYQKSRKKLFASMEGRSYIESSNFLFGCMPPLREVYGEVKVIHLVRHPLSYVSSRLGKGFWRSHKRLFARYVPYWLEKLKVDDPNDPIQLLSARWNYVNQQIGSYGEGYPYLRIRFEDLFSENKQTSSDALNQIRKFCGLSTLDSSENESWLGIPKNVSRRKHSLQTGEKKYIQAACSDLMEEYQYSPEPA